MKQFIIIGLISLWVVGCSKQKNPVIEQEILKSEEANVVVNEIKHSELGEQVSKIRLSYEKGESLITLYDNPSSQDFIRLLPMTLTFTAYNNSEKIASLPRDLTIDETPMGHEPKTGAFARY